MREARIGEKGGPTIEVWRSKINGERDARNTKIKAKNGGTLVRKGMERNQKMIKNGFKF